MALATFVSGRYSCTWNAVDLGITDNDGWDLSWQYPVEAINSTDQYGMTWVDGVYQGVSDVFLQANGLEYKAGPLAAATPFATMTPTGASGLSLGTIGILVSGVAKALTLTATAGTPAAASPATLSATLAVWAENYPVHLLMNPKLRKFPIRMRILPYSATGIKFFTTT